MVKKTHDEYSKLTQEIVRVFEIIHRDRIQLRNLPYERTDGFFRRTMLRQLFAEAEVKLFQLRLLLQIICEADFHALGAAEATVLYEKTYDVNEKGVVAEKRLTLRTMVHFRFLFKTIANVTGCYELIDCSSRDWSLFKGVNKKRDEITHPRSAFNYEITDSEFKDIIHVATWLDGIFNNALGQLTQFLLARSNKGNEDIKTGLRFKGNGSYE